jgi:hypothetical protein
MANDAISQSIELTSMASAKIVGHALRFPHNQIHGILLGKFSEGSEGPTLTICDSIPVCHSSPTKPIVDMAMRLIEAHLDSVGVAMNPSTHIVGWYTANERNDDETPGHAALKITSTLSDYFTNDPSSSSNHELVLVSLMPKGLKHALTRSKENEVDDPLFKIYGKDASRKQWLREYSTNRIFCASNRAQISALSSSSQSSTFDFFDFESHLSGGIAHVEITDWIHNAKFAKLIQ